jgi:hypothetical protein
VLTKLLRVCEVSTNVGVIIRNKSFGLVRVHALGINTGSKDLPNLYDLRQYQPSRD